MENQKNKSRKRILSVLHVVPILLYALLVPIGAVVNSSQGTFMDFDLTARSTFPLTVGFSYTTRDSDLGVGNTYVYATEIGGYGEEWNSTISGQDTYVHNYNPGQGYPEYDLEGTLTYNFDERVWPESDEITYTDGQYTSTYRRGYQLVTMTNKAPSGGNVAGYQQGIVLRASDIVYNPRWGNADQYGVYSNAPMLPTIQKPTVANPDAEAIRMTYSYRFTIIDEYGKEKEYSDFQTYDTRTNNDGGFVQIIPEEYLSEYYNSYTIIIDDYYGFIDIDYYENTALEDDPLAGTWLINVPPEHYTSATESIFLEGSFYGLNEEQEMELFPLTELWWGYWDATSSGVGVEVSILSAYSGDRFASSGFSRTSFASNLEYIRCRFYGSALTYEKRFDSTDEALLNLYRSINITTPYSEAVVTNGEDEVNKLLSRLQGSATKQGSTNSGEPVWEEVDSPADGYSFSFTYPLYDTSGITITESATYGQYYDNFGFPDMAKYVDTLGDKDIIVPDYNVDYSGWLNSAVGGFLNFELFPNFTLGGIIGILVSFSFIMLFLKFFAGG